MTRAAARPWRIAVPVLMVIAVASAAAVTRGRAKREATIPAGTILIAALEQSLSTEASRVGDRIDLRTVKPLRLDAGTVVPAGVAIRGAVIAVESGGRAPGPPKLALRFTELEIDGASHAISADLMQIRGWYEAAPSAGIGRLLRRAPGSSAGQVTEAVTGIAIGSGAAIATTGGQLVLRTGQRLKILLNDAVRVAYRPGADARKTYGA